MTVSETAWVDNGAFSPNRGQFPIQVERHLNAFVADHLPGVTTVTLGARYYSLHAHVAYRANEQDLDEDQTRRLLRRSEALLAYVTSRHSGDADHVDETPPGHGIDAIPGSPMVVPLALIWRSVRSQARTRSRSGASPALTAARN